jgi:hypothetical protein
MPACTPAAPGASPGRARTDFERDPTAVACASCAALVAGGAMLTVSVPTFVAGTWLLLAGGCALVESAKARRRTPVADAAVGLSRPSPGPF